MKHRLERVNEVIKRELSDLILRRCHFDAVLVTVQQVDIAPNLKHAHVYVCAIGATAEQHQAMAQLHKVRTELQRELSKRIVLKFTPHLHFQLDSASERGDRVLQLLSELDVPPESPETP